MHIYLYIYPCLHTEGSAAVESNPFRREESKQVKYIYTYSIYLYTDGQMDRWIYRHTYISVPAYGGIGCCREQSAQARGVKAGKMYIHIQYIPIYR